MEKFVKKTTFVLIAVLISSPALVPIATAAPKAAPKVGNCYNLTKAQVDADYSDINPVNCLKTHSAETYRVVNLKSNDLAAKYDLKKAMSVCQPWKGNSKFFNYWAWYIPNPEQQAAGQNWIRCDAMIDQVVNDDPSDITVTFWKGKRLDVR
jgi:hypothetical protein